MSTARARWRRVATGVTLGLAVALPATTHAQQPVYTLDDVLVALRRGADTIDLARVNPAQDRALDSVSAMFRASGAAPLTIDALAEIITKRRATFRDVARWNPQPRAPWAEPWFYDALVRLRRIANAAGTGIGPRLVAAFGSAGAERFIAPMDELETRVLRLAQAQNAEKLRRYEIKYGPESARLNIVEVLLNYAAERPSWSPFGPDENGPSPLEIVATYSTSELTGSKSKSATFRPHVVSGAHAGLRYYRFGASTARGSRFQRFLKPQHVGAGMFFMGATDHPLISPFEKRMRSGGFLDWGLARTGVVVGRDWRAVIGVGKQILPYLF